MSDQQLDKSQFDPLSFWKELQDISMTGWAKMMTEAVASEEFAQAIGQALGLYLETSAPLRQQTERLMGQNLAQMNMPTRQDVTRLAERLTNLEMRADDIEAKMDEVLDRLKTIQAMLK